MVDFKAVAIGDLHLDGMMDLGLEGNEKVIKEVQRVQNWCLDNGVFNIILLGDVCDKPILSYEAHRLLMETFARFKDMTYYIILGNHDWRSNGNHSLQLLESFYKNSDNVHIITEPTQHLFGKVKVNFLPYPYPNKKCDLDLKNAINVAHFEVEGSTRDNGSLNDGGAKVPKGTTWLMGHLHTPHDVGGVHYVGTLFQRNFGESLPKSFSFIQAKMSSGQLTTKIRRVNHEPLFKLINKDIVEQDDLTSITSNPNHLYKLTVAANVILPPTFLLGRPNIVRTQVYKNKAEKALLLSDYIIIEQSDGSDDYDVHEGLDDYLESQGLEESEIARCHELIQQLEEVNV